MSDRWEIPGSEGRQLPGSEVLGDADPAQEVTVTLVVRSKRPGIPPPGAMSRADFAHAYGADASDLEKVETFARAHGLAVVERSAARRSVVLRGSVAQMNDAFGVKLQRCRAGATSYRGRQGSLSVPNDLAEIVQAVLGLDNRPQAETRVRIAEHAATSFTPVQWRSSTIFQQAWTERASVSASSSWAAVLAKRTLTHIFPVGAQGANRDRRFGGRRNECSGPGLQRRCRSDARRRNGRSHCTGIRHRYLFCAEHRPRFSRCRYDRSARSDS